jgi:hypothetical protein
MTIKYTIYDNSPGFNNDRWESNAIYTYQIPIDKLGKLSFVKTNGNYQIIFKINTNDSLIHTTFNFKSGNTNESQNKIENSISLYIPETLLTNNLPERLTHAFINLTRLCGGKVTKEVF